MGISVSAVGLTSAVPQNLKHKLPDNEARLLLAYTWGNKLRLD